MKFEVGQKLEWYKMTEIGWLEHSHYCNDKNDECKEEDMHCALTSEMYLQDYKVVEVGLTTVTLEYFDGWHTTKQKYKKKDVVKILKDNKDKETFYQWLKEDIIKTRMKNGFA